MSIEANKKEKIVIVGAGEFAEIAYQYFTYDSAFEVAAFSVEREFLKDNRLLGLPVVPFEEIEARYPPTRFKVFVAVTYTRLNRVRGRLFRECKRKGYTCVSYVSSRAFVWRNVKMGENCFIFENNVLQYHVQLGDNVILWSGNHIGHRTVIGDNVYAASHVVISGYCKIGENCFLGVNCSFNDKLVIAKDCIIGNGAVVIKNTEPGKVYVGNPARPTEKTAYEAFAVREDEM
jgi:sugar O-acyltransferase (sialic acid O-acetyltransferase NeuD family)